MRLALWNRGQQEDIDLTVIDPQQKFIVLRRWPSFGWDVVDASKHGVSIREAEEIKAYQEKYHGDSKYFILPVD